MERFGEKLRTLRKRRGLTLKEVAHALGLTAHSYISELESGKSKPTGELAVRVALLFNVSTDQLLMDELEVD